MSAKKARNRLRSEGIVPKGSDVFIKTEHGVESAFHSQGIGIEDIYKALEDPSKDPFEVFLELLMKLSKPMRIREKEEDSQEKSTGGETAEITFPIIGGETIQREDDTISFIVTLPGHVLDIRYKGDEFHKALTANGDKIHTLICATRREVQMRNEARQKIQALRTHFSGEIHDFKQPLTYIVAEADMVEREMGNSSFGIFYPGTLESVKGINQEATRLSRMIAGTLSQSYRETKEDYSTINIVLLIREVIAKRKNPHRHDVTVEMKANEAQIYANEDDIRRLIANILENAEKYSPANRFIETRIRTTKGFIIVQVKDKGIGFDVEPEKLTEAFFRTPEAQEKEEGFGLGLSSCRLICEKYGARIIPHSEGIGKGSTFSLVFHPKNEGSTEMTEA